MTYLSRGSDNGAVKTGHVRTSIDLPVDVHQRLHEAAARKGCSARRLILSGIEKALEQSGLMVLGKRLVLEPSLIKPAGRGIELSSERIYELIELP